MAVEIEGLGLQVEVAFVSVDLDKRPGLRGPRTHPWPRSLTSHLGVDLRDDHGQVQGVSVEPSVAVITVQVVEQKLCGMKYVSMTATLKTSWISNPTGWKLPRGLELGVLQAAAQIRARQV